MRATSAVRLGMDAFPSSGAIERKAIPRRTVLVVDESATIRVLAQEILAKLGYRGDAVDAVRLPREALARIGQPGGPSVVLMELDFEQEDGLPCALEMLERDPHLKLIVLTAEGTTCERVRRVVRAGAFAVLEKPLRHDKVRAVIADLDMEEGGIERVR